MGRGVCDRVSTPTTWQVETALRSPPSGTHRAHPHTHSVFPCVRESPGRPALLLSVSPLAVRTTSTRHRITRVALVRAPSAEYRSDVQKYPLSRFSSCVLFPRHTTHIRAPAFSFSPAITIAPYGFQHFEFCVFSISIPGVDGATVLGTLDLISSGLLSFVFPDLQRYDDPGSDQQEPGHRR